jgi:hypothetical protein
MRADCKECQTLQLEYEEISEAYLALAKKIRSDATGADNPERAATLDQGLVYIENGMADLSVAIQQHEAGAHSGHESSKDYAAGQFPRWF